MGKKDPLKDKPRIPSNEEIVQDLTRAPVSDIIFQLSLHGSEYNTMLHADASNSNSSISGNTDNSQTDKKELDETYERLTSFIEKYEQLQKEPEILKDKYEHLKQLGQDVSESISDLKSAAENVSGARVNSVS